MGVKIYTNIEEFNDSNLERKSQIFSNFIKAFPNLSFNATGSQLIKINLNTVKAVDFIFTLSNSDLTQEGEEISGLFVSSKSTSKILHEDESVRFNLSFKELNSETVIDFGKYSQFSMFDIEDFPFREITFSNFSLVQNQESEFFILLLKK